MRDRIRVLFLASDPFRDRAPLRLDEEVRAIDHALRKGSARDRVELVSHFATRTRDLQDALMRHDPQIVHFAGHADDGPTRSVLQVYVGKIVTQEELLVHRGRIQGLRGSAEIGRGYVGSAHSRAPSRHGAEEGGRLAIIHSNCRIGSQCERECIQSSEKDLRNL